MKIVNYFHRSYKAGALLSEDIKNNLIEGGGLKGYCKTHWSTAFDCLTSILRCKRSLHNILETQPDTLSSEVKDLLRNRIFFQNVEELIKIIKPIKEVLTSLEYKMTTLSDCFIQLMKLGIMIQIPNVLNQEFHSYCLEKFNLRWSQFNFKLYLLGYFFHPSYRGKGLKIGVFCQICHWSIELLINNISGGKNSANKLVGQMADYKDFKVPYEFEYIPGTFSIERCERLFSVLGWMCSKRRSRLSIDRIQSMAKLHSYYVNNALKEMNYAFSNITEDEFFRELNKSFNDITKFSEEVEEQEEEFNQPDEEEDLDQDNEELPKENNEIIIDKYFDINEELRRALGVEVRVVVEQPAVPAYDHGEKEFDINELLNSTLN
ncbi:unnamed protein product [Rhizophagus irregularis]|uniref:Uncharacterized protein n=1 Tax=Rhizophagus irregularis TaxID=588596 RepID=A0A916E7B7_9GLOM|nr:unnamed protein product [Rhizophagus irregularis]